MTFPPEGIKKALDDQTAHPEKYFDVHVGVAPRDYLIKPASDLAGRLPEYHYLFGGVMLFHERGGFYTWHEDYEHGPHEPGHLLVRLPHPGPVTRAGLFAHVEGYVEVTLDSFVSGWRDDFRISDYMVIDRDITCWGNGNETFTHRIS